MKSSAATETNQMMVSAYALEKTRVSKVMLINGTSRSDLRSIVGKGYKFFFF